MSAQQEQPKKSFNKLSDREQQAAMKKRDESVKNQLQEYREQQAQMARQRLPMSTWQAKPARPEQVLPARQRQVLPPRPLDPKLSDLDERLKQIDSDEKLARELMDMELALKIAAEEASGSTSFLRE
jgi:hypothetical protein